MKKNGRRVVCLCVMAAMLIGMLTVPGYAVIDGQSVNGVSGFTGAAVMVADPIDSDNRVLKLENGTESMSLINDMGDTVTYSGKILVSAKLYTQSGTSCTLKVNNAEYAVTGNGSWQTAAILYNTDSGKYDAYLNKEWKANGTCTQTAVSGVDFVTTGTAYIDDIKVERFDEVYSAARQETIFEDTFDTLTENAKLFGQNGWSGNQSQSSTDYGYVKSAAAHGTNGKGVDFTRNSMSSGTTRVLHSLTAQTGDFIVSMNLKTNADTETVTENGKLAVKLRQGPNDSGDVAAEVFVQKHRIGATGTDSQTFQNVTRPGEWFNLKLVFNAAGKTYNIFYNDQKVNERPLAYMANPTQIATLVFEMQAAGTWYMDDLKVSRVVDQGTTYQTVFSDDFSGSTFDVQAKDGTAATKWKYGTRNAGNAANAAYALTTPTAAGITGGSYAQGNILDIKTMKVEKAANDQATNESGITFGDTNIRSEAIVAHLSESLRGNARISMDVYARDVFYKISDTNTRRDNFRIAWTKDYNYNNGNNAIAEASSTYLHWQSGNVFVNGAGDADKVTTYTQKAWNHIVIDVDEDNGITVNVNGTSRKSTKTSIGEITDLVLYVPYNQGGWWYLDNVKVEKAQSATYHPNIETGICTTLIQNNIDEMNTKVGTDAFSVMGVYFTKDGGKTYEPAPRDDGTYVLHSVEVMQNQSGFDGTLSVYAAIYNQNALTSAAYGEISTMPSVGGTAEVSFLSNQMTVGKDSDLRIYVWDKDSLEPLAQAYLLQNDNRVTVFIASDSLAAPYGASLYPQKSWGDLIGNAMDTSKVRVANYALGGRSSKSFYHEAGRWDAIKEAAKSGDYVLISFGHNDSKSGDGYYTDPSGAVTDESSYLYWLNKYATDCAELGLHPIYISPMPRRDFDNDGKFRADELRTYVRAMKNWTAENGYDFIDINRVGIEHLSILGETGSASLYLIFNTADFADDSYFASSVYNPANENNKLEQDYSHIYHAETGLITDNTHFSASGAQTVMGAIVKGLHRIDGIGAYVK